MAINVQDLESNDRQKRLEVIEKIHQQRDISVLDVLIDHLEREGERVIKEKIAMVLDDLLPEASAESIGRMIRSEDAFTRNCVVETMKMATDIVIPILGELSTDNNQDVRKFAIDALINRDTPEVHRILRERLSDDDPNVVYTAVDYLGNLRDPKARGAIELLALNTDNNPMLFCTCLESLAKIGTAACNQDLIAHCNNIGSEPLFRYSILKYMGCCASYEAVENYILDLAGQSGELFAKEIVDTMEAVCHREADIKISAQLKEVLRRLMTSIGASENKYELAKLLADNINIEETRASARLDLTSSDPMILLAALEIIGKYGEEEDLDRLDELAEQTDSDEVLELIGDAAENIMNAQGGTSI